VDVPPFVFNAGSDPLAVLRTSDKRQMLFLFDQGADYLLECLRFRGMRYERKAATSAKASHAGQSNEQIVQAMMAAL
jgi:hypothetical protein